MTAMTMPDRFTSTFISAPDGLRLHARCYGGAARPRLPVVCLPGLARTAADFDALGEALASDASRPRRVIALDYRGRGQSEYDRDPANYNFQVELADVLAVIAALDAARGDLRRHLARRHPRHAARRRAADRDRRRRAQRYRSGDRAEGADADQGLCRQAAAAAILRGRRRNPAPPVRRAISQARTPADWLASAHRTFRQENGALVPTYDVKLAKTLEGVDFEKPFPPLWAQFDALGHSPMMVIRGANSDILSPATVEAMRARRADAGDDRGARSGPCAAAGRARRD